MAANQLNYFEHQQGAGWNGFPDRTTERFIAHNDPEVRTRSITVASGQVLKARSWVESDTAGKMIAHGTVAETASIAFSGTMASTDTTIIAGVTLTATATMSAAEVVAAFLTGASTKGTLSGTSTGWTLQAGATSTVLEAISTTTLTNVTNLAVTGTHTSLTATVTTVTGTTTFNKPAGFLAFDVDATSADTLATIYVAGSFWEDALLWEVDTSVDVVTKADGTTVACTAYNTGAVTSLTRQKFVEGLQIELVPIKAGEFM